MQTAKLEALRKREAELKAQIVAAEAKEKAKAQKQEIRLKLLIGAAFVSNTVKNPDTRAGVVAVLESSVVDAKDRAFLKSKGWL